MKASARLTIEVARLEATSDVAVSLELEVEAGATVNGSGVAVELSIIFDVVLKAYYCNR